MYLVSRKETFAKLFFLLSFSGLVMYIVLAFYTFHTAYLNLSRPERFRLEDVSRRTKPETRKKQNQDMKNILLWSNPLDQSNFTHIGQDLFTIGNCTFQNCFMTANKTYLNAVSDFEAIVFNQRSLGVGRWKKHVPEKRSPKQKYIFFSMLPALSPICNNESDSFFNWTWSYKRYSDIMTPFIEVRNMSNVIVGPILDDSKEIKAISNESAFDFDSALDMTTEDFYDTKHGKPNKTKTLVIYFTNCNIPLNVRLYVLKLKKTLKKNGHIFDIFGCGYGQCPKGGCLKAIERDYYFYLVYQNYITEDYVTDEILKAYDHNVVPIVVGGTDYSRFLPFGSYINAAHESLDLLFALISYTITSPGAYQKFFSWKKHFKIQRSSIATGFCKLCAMLNDQSKMEKRTTYENFRKWWYYGDLSTKCLPKSGELIADVLSYIKKNDKKKNDSKKNDKKTDVKPKARATFKKTILEGGKTAIDGIVDFNNDFFTGSQSRKEKIK